MESPTELEAGIKEALAHDGPVLLDVVIPKQELVLPPKIQLEQAKGFRLYVLKANITVAATRWSNWPALRMTTFLNTER